MNVFSDFLNVKFKTEEKTCEKHGLVSVEVAYMQDGTQNWTCPLCDQENQALEDEKVKKELHEAQIRTWKESNVEDEYLNLSFADYKPSTDTQVDALNCVKEIVKNRKGKLVLLGGNGVGKTMLASLAVKELGGKILSMYEISTMIRQSYTSRAKKTELEIVKELATMPFLAIDELGRTKGSDAELNWLSYVLDKRHTRNLPFMIMSNTHFSKYCPNGGCTQCFENYLNNDILSRLRQNTKFVNIKAKDYRANNN